jgi:galactosylceramidase
MAIGTPDWLRFTYTSDIGLPYLLMTRRGRYLKTLRRVLDSRGLQRTFLVGGDVHSWVDPLCDAVINGSDPELRAAVAVIGKHYPSTRSTTKAARTGLPLWSSEDYAADNHGSGGRCEARILNQNFVGGQMTATIAWNLISSYYPWLAWANDGLMTARSPWSGAFSVDPPVFAAAHTARFAAVGSWLLSVGSGSGYLHGGGSYVSYVGGDNDAEFTLVIEKVPALEHKYGYRIPN